MLSRRDILGSRRDLLEHANEWVPAPKGIAGCKLQKNKNEALGCLCVKFDASSFEQALEESKETDKPVLIIFQIFHGVPAAVAIGKTVLSHPLLIEAADSLFITVSVDVGGTTQHDVRLLSRYHESRNHETAIHIVNSKGQDLVLKLEGSRCSIGNVAKAMRGVLERKALKVPTYLKLLEAEFIARDEAHTKIAQREANVIAFRTKQIEKIETLIAELNGVVAIECGTIGRGVVVKVTYNPAIVDCKSIVVQALSMGGIETVYWSDPRQVKALESELKLLDVPPQLDELGPKSVGRSKDSKHYLRKTLLRFLPLTSLQALQANLAISRNQNELIDDLLSPRQLAILEAVETKRPRRDTVDIEIIDAWEKLDRDGIFDWG